MLGRVLVEAGREKKKNKDQLHFAFIDEAST